MWMRAWIAFGVTTCAWTQQTDPVQNGARFEWGWQLAPSAPSTVGHYYVKLPQAEQSVRYAADSSGYHGALALNASDGEHVHTANFALGQRALELNRHNILPQPFQLRQEANTTQHQQLNAPNAPLEIFLLQQQFPSASDQELIQVLPTAIPGNLVQYNPTQNYFYPTNHVTAPLYNLQQHHPAQINNNKNNENDRSRPLQKEDTKEQDHEVLTSSVVKVFKDHNCSHDDSISDSVAKESVSDVQKPNKISAKVPDYEIRNTNDNFGAKGTTERPLTYRGAVNFRVESPRENARSERYYYTTISSLTEESKEESDGISKLVASTQDLISNEDLLRINHAAEKQVNIHTDDIIKPKPRFNLKAEQTKYSRYEPPRSRITVKAKIGKIVDSDIEQIENNQSKEQVLQTSLNEYKFASPIVVADNANSYKEQIVNNLVSTMVPYIEDGYGIVSVRNSLEENYKERNENQNSNEDTIDVTPRPIGQTFLAPITVALRLLNANDTDTLNSVEDHDTSDSEFIAETVESPRKEKTLVEIQESIPVSITHINDVEVHEYLDEGRANNKGTLDIARSLYNKYLESLENSKQNYKNVNHIHYKYRSKNPDNDNSNENESNSDEDNDEKENIDQSENIQSEVHVKPSEEASNERSELIHYYSDYDSQKIIQPIIIEKEVPITKYVDRFIEKPYPEPVEVVKHVPVDRPVAVPVPYEKVVEKPVEVTKYVDKPYPVEIHHPYPVEVKVPYPVEKKVYVDRPVPYQIEKVVERQVLQAVPVPTPVAVPYEVHVPVEHKVLYPVPIETPVPVPVEVEKPVPVEKIVHKEVPVPYPVEKRVPYPVHYETKVPVPYPVEKRVPYPVDRIVEKPVTVTKVVEKPVHIQVPVPQPVPYPVHVREPYPVDRIVEKKVPYPVHVDRIVEKKVPIKVPYPVQTVVEKIVEKPVYVTKYVDKPYPVEKRVPYPVEKIVEKKVPYPVPVEVKVPYPFERLVEKPVHGPVKPPYPAEKPVAILGYGYNYGHGGNQQTQNIPQYVRHDQNQESSNQVLRDIQQMQAHVQSLKEQQKQNMQTSHWGNQYASSYQYVNATNPQVNDIRKSLAEYIGYVTNVSANQNQYYGPPPLQNYDNWWENNKNYVVEMKVRRTDRTPKVTKLRIEYGGFKPPLIPSTEVDLDGIPVKKDEEQS